MSCSDLDTRPSWALIAEEGYDSRESMLVIAAVGIPASLKLGGYDNVVIILIFAGLYGVAFGSK